MGPRAHIPNEVRRKVLERDGFRCTYSSPGGQRCECTRFLQIHHDHAWAKGGPETLENLRLLCSAHNQLLAEMEFGERQPTGST
jgi:5-methylcytosine-specific restriction endonuclease McrA